MARGKTELGPFLALVQNPSDGIKKLIDPFAGSCRNGTHAVSSVAAEPLRRWLGNGIDLVGHNEMGDLPRPNIL